MLPAAEVAATAAATEDLEHRRRLHSQHRSKRRRFFPCRVPALAARLPGGVVIDGELVSRNVARELVVLDERLAHTSPRRPRAGRRGLSAVRRAAVSAPATLVGFELPVLDGQDPGRCPGNSDGQVLDGLRSVES